MQILSFIPIGIPARLLVISPFSIFLSISSAFLIASSVRGVIKACTYFSFLFILSTYAFVILLDVKAYKGAKNQHKVDLEIISTNNKITNNDFMLTFFQKENVSQKVLPLTASIYFVDEYDEIISNEVIIIANKNTDSAEDREFKETFVLKNIAYDKSKDYYLEIKDKDSEEVIKRERFIIDLPFQDGFDFF